MRNPDFVNEFDKLGTCEWVSIEMNDEWLNQVSHKYKSQNTIRKRQYLKTGISYKLDNLAVAEEQKKYELEITNGCKLLNGLVDIIVFPFTSSEIECKSDDDNYIVLTE